MNSELAASIAIKNKNNTWVPDGAVTQCMYCGIIFGLFKGKHHCRSCGNIFCWDCCKRTIIPEFITDKPEPEDYRNLSYYFPVLKPEQELVCIPCFNIIDTKKKVYQKILEIFNNPVSIDKIRELSDSSTEVKTHYFDHLRNIQYYLPNHQYSEIDKKLLKINAAYFPKHSKYLVHLIKSIDFLTEKRAEETNFIMGILHSEQTKQCCDLYCTRTCHESLSFDDCVNILYNNPENLPDDLLRYLFNIIETSPDVIVVTTLPFFVNIIKNNRLNRELIFLLKNLLTRSEYLTYQTFWYLSYNKEKANENQLLNIRVFFEFFDKNLLQQMNRDCTFFVGLVKNLSDVKKYLEEEFPKYKPISLPYNPKLKIVNVDLDKIEKKQSKTEPVILSFSIMEEITCKIDDCGNITPFDENNHINNDDESQYKLIKKLDETTITKIKILFKKENVMKDTAVLNLMNICRILLLEEFCIDFGLVTYTTMPITSNTGMIEIVDDAETIYELNTRKRTISQFILENNEREIVGEVLDRYMYSLVSYTLYSYLIGIGDRHKHNIMISNCGTIFHIDFGYILGNDAYPLYPSEIRIDSEMIDVIGGCNGERYKRYIKLCSIGIIFLRKFFNVFFILLSQCENLDPKNIEKFILSRFQPRQVDDVIISELVAIISKSNNAYTEYVRDLIHFHTQEKTIQNGFSNIIEIANNAIRNIKFT